jgi:hypothetical protein
VESSDSGDAVAVAEGEVERRGETDGKHGAQQGGCSRQHQDRIGVVGEGRDGERLDGVVSGDESQVGRDLDESLVGLCEQDIDH